MRIEIGKRLGEALGDKLSTAPARPSFPRSSPPYPMRPAVPDYTPPPPPSMPNLSGQWGSNYGMPHMIQQSGNTITIQAVDAFGRTMVQGQGAILGNVVDLAYTAYMPRSRLRDALVWKFRRTDAACAARR